MQIIAQYGDLGPKWFYVSLSVLVQLGKTGSLMTSKELSELTNTESSFIRKVLNKLVDAGLVEAKEGKYGGYSLVVAPEKINVADIYLLLSKEQYMKNNNPFTLNSDQKIAHIVQKSENQFVNSLKEYNIVDLF